MLKIALVILLIVPGVFAQTIDEKIAALQSSIDSIRTIGRQAGAARTVAMIDIMISANSLTALATNSVTVVADERDTVWVQIDVPLSAATGIEKSYWVRWIEYAKQTYGAKDGTATGRVRLRKDKAETALKDLDANLKVQ